MAESTPPPKSRNERSGKFSIDSMQHSDTTHAHCIRVDVSATYVSEQSKPEETHYVFSYTITIRNEGKVPARLLTRHWVITDANGKVKEVRGEGVVGEQPYLLPGQGFRYSSGAVLETPVGAMQGSYQMLGDDGAQFDAQIAPFTLAVPGLLH
jgi:ApaG protein